MKILLVIRDTFFVFVRYNEQSESFLIFIICFVFDPSPDSAGWQDWFYQFVLSG